MHFDKKYNLFYIKNIREGYFDTITHICKNNNYTELNESLLTLLVQLLHVDYFFAYYRQSILENIVFLLNKTSLSGINNTCPIERLLFIKLFNLLILSTVVLNSLAIEYIVSPLFTT